MCYKQLFHNIFFLFLICFYFAECLRNTLLKVGLKANRVFGRSLESIIPVLSIFRNVIDVNDNFFMCCYWIFKRISSFVFNVHVVLNCYLKKASELNKGGSHRTRRQKNTTGGKENGRKNINTSIRPFFPSDVLFQNKNDSFCGLILFSSSKPSAFSECQLPPPPRCSISWGLKKSAGNQNEVREILFWPSLRVGKMLSHCLTYRSLRQQFQGIFLFSRCSFKESFLLKLLQIR